MLGKWICTCGCMKINLKLKATAQQSVSFFVPKKNEAVVKYSVLKDNQQLFASKYSLYLPTEKELKEELERERHLAELRMAQNK